MVRTFAADGSARGAGPAVLEVPARGANRAPVAEIIEGYAADAVLVVVDVESGSAGGGGSAQVGFRTTRWLGSDVELDLAEADLEVRAVAAGVDEVSVEVRAAGLVRDLCLLAELVVPDAVVSQQLVTLLPGESAIFTVTGPGAAAVPAEQWSSLLWHDARLR
jgi:beta-mannosidase